MNTVDIATFSKDVVSMIESTVRARAPFIVVSKAGSVVIIDEAHYREMAKAVHNETFLAMLDESNRQIEDGNVIVKTIEELDAMTI